MKKFVQVLIVCHLFVGHLPAQSASGLSNENGLAIFVTDENGVSVPDARVVVSGPNGHLTCETDRAGRCRFPSLIGSPWALRVERETFYVFSISQVQTSGTLEISLKHQQEIRETVNVVESPPAIDPAKVASQEQLSGLDIINIPYPNTRDYRYALAFIPGVVLDPSAQPHLAGGETYQTLTLLDGFNLTQPANGQLLLRVSTDALRDVDVETTRISPEFGKGPAGLLSLETGIGDDHYRFAMTNFVPSFQNKKGWTLDKVDPRFTLSGPIKKGKLWFFDGIDGEYDNVVIPDLPSGEDTDTVWRLGNIAKVQMNLSQHDIVTSSFVINRLHDEHLGFSTLAPANTRPIDEETLYVASLKEQHTFSLESMVELGFAFSRYGLQQTPQGNAPYALTPQGTTGNYYLNARTVARRSQGIVNFYFPKHFHGRHDFMAGIDLDRLDYDQRFMRSPITSLRNCIVASPSCYPVALRSTFFASSPSAIYNFESSGFVQDRWSLSPRLLLEYGLRLDWDEIVRRPLVSPRVAGTYVLDNSGNTKLSAGVGITYQSTNLALVAAPDTGARSDTFYDITGHPSSFITTFSVDRSHLLAPRYLNWSVALERKLPAQIFLKTEFMQRTGVHGFVYDAPPLTAVTNYGLQNTRDDTYRALKVDVRRTFKKQYVITASYTRSTTRSNQVLDYSLDSLIHTPQVPGPYPWDVPNRFISWGWLPLVHGFDAGYSLETHTGFPFGAINDQQQLVRRPGTYRFPTYFTLNFHLEKRFHALGFYWALRGGFDNITNRQNAYTVNNNIDSPQFLTFSNFDRRAFTARIRFLGRK